MWSRVSLLLRLTSDGFAMLPIRKYKSLNYNKMIKENFLEAKVLSIMNETYWTEEEYKKEKLDYFESLEEIKKYLEKSNAMSCKEF